MSNAELNQKMYDTVRAWCQQAALAISGVSLADCMAYDALSVIGRQIVNSQDEQQAKQQPQPSEANT